MKNKNLILGLILVDVMVIFYIWEIFKKRGTSIATVGLGLLVISITLYIHFLIKNKSYKKALVVIGIGILTLPLISSILWLGLTCK